jgi:hypothetical protein
MFLYLIGTITLNALLQKSQLFEYKDRMILIAKAKCIRAALPSGAP